MIPLLLPLALLSAALASDDQYRRFVLLDGREVAAEVLSTEATGFKVRVPQGEFEISYELLADMQNIDTEQYQRQAPWTVWLAGTEEAAKPLRVALSAVPSIKIGNPDNAVLRTRTASCGVDMACLKQALDDGSPSPWIITVVKRGERLQLEMAAVRSVTSGKADVQAEPNAVLSQIYDLWAVEPHRPLPPLAVKPPSPDLVQAVPSEVVAPAATPPVPGDGFRLSPPKKVAQASVFVPLPGYTALRAGDKQRFALAMATAIPATALWAGAVGSNATSFKQHLAMSLAGYYVASVVANQWIAGHPGVSPAIGFAPSPDGGSVVVAASFR